MLFRDLKKEFKDIIKTQAETNNRKKCEIWYYAMTGMASRLNITCDCSSAEANDRLIMYLAAKSMLNDKIDELLDIVRQAMTENPEQDFLGSIYMEFGLPINFRDKIIPDYNSLCALNNQVFEEMLDKIQTRGYMILELDSVYSGGRVIDLFNRLDSYGYAPQNRAFFSAHNEMDIMTLMTYIQLSVLNIAAVCVTHRVLRVDGEIMKTNYWEENYSLWYTPICFYKVWTSRIDIKNVTRLINEGLALK